MFRRKADKTQSADSRKGQADKGQAESALTLGGRIKKQLAKVLLLTGLAVVLLIAGLVFIAVGKFESPGPLAEDRILQIERGLGLAAIAARLEREKIVGNRHLFRWGVWADGGAGQLKAGEYEIPAAASMQQIMEILRDGKVYLHRVTVPEGLSSYQIVEILNAEPVLLGDALGVPLEGSLLPDTYFFPRGTSRAEILAWMRAAQREVLEELWPDRDGGLPYASIAEALTMASIVEEETAVPSERPQVAAVFVNRLKRHMRLQSDPTIIYGITAGKGPLGRPIRQSELKRKTPYNTYQVDGLPPTPIANPGRASIEAVLHPAQSKDLYFVADGTGGHVFSSTLAQHNRNVAKYRALLREQRSSQ